MSVHKSKEETAAPIFSKSLSTFSFKERKNRHWAPMNVESTLNRAEVTYQGLLPPKSLPLGTSDSTLVSLIVMVKIVGGI